jgi:hypothetical protein
MGHRGEGRPEIAEIADIARDRKSERLTPDTEDTDQE